MKHEIKVPEVGESISEVVVAEWLKNDGDYVEPDDVICEIESDKASFEVPVDQAGILEIKAQVDDTVAVGDTLAIIDTEGETPESKPESEAVSEEKPEPEKPEETPEEETEKAPSRESETASEETRVSPVASNILKEAGINPNEVKGTGIGGKITKADAQRAVHAANGKEKTEPEEPPAPSKKEPSKPPRVEFSGDRETERKRMSTLRRTIAERLVSAKNDTAMLTTFNEIDMTAVMETRNQYKELFEEKHDVRLGFMSFFTRACAIAIKDFPIINAQIDGNEIVYHRYADIAIAVSTDRGLVVPVIKNADKLSYAEIEKKVNDLATRARENKLDIDEMRGGTFTISNGGIFGSLLSTPIINAPQSAILGLHKIEDRPVAVDGQVEVRPMMYVAMSYDHRIIDGKDSVQFLVRVKELIEDPSRMLLDV